MPRGENLPDVANAETRARGASAGGKARAAAIAARKQADAERIEAAFSERLDKMFERLDAVLAEGADPDAVRVILAGFERLAGKPIQPTEVSGSIDHNHYAVQAREHLATRLAHRAALLETNGDSGEPE
jgi:hypothetical protein